MAENAPSRQHHPRGFDDKISFIWSIAEILRGDFKEHEYGQVMLPFVVLRRLECALADTKPAVIARAVELEGKVENRDRLLQKAARRKFYNLSPLDLTTVLQDTNNVASNLRAYIGAFSPGAVEVLEKYKFDDKITALDSAGLLYEVVAKFADLDLTEKAVPNAAMGYIFEELLRRFSEMSNETAGEHFTPREVIRLMVNILFSEDTQALTGVKPVRTIYDPACGTGGMLSAAEEYLRELNPNAVLEQYGQELNAETWAICRSDLMLKGQDPDRISFGNSLTTTDGHAGERFDYILANPPFGVNWKKYAADIQNEHAKQGMDGRYGPGLPRVSDGSMLFLLHMLAKMKPVADDPNTPDIIEGGSRIAVVFSGSPLFSGSAGSGESEIRRWILENDLLEGIVALPDQMFYNTGISTYFWILTNRKKPERVGKVVLLDARDEFTKMRKSLGEKRKTMTDEQISAVTVLYETALDSPTPDSRVKVFDRETFGYQRITVEQPLRQVWKITDDTVAALTSSKAWTAWADQPPADTLDGGEWVSVVGQAKEHMLTALGTLSESTFVSEVDFSQALTGALGEVDVPAVVVKEVRKIVAVTDPEGEIVVDRRGNVVPDSDLRDQENVALPAGYLPLSDDAKGEMLTVQAEQYLVDEVRPYLPDAWVDCSKTKVGYEIPFTRHFYHYTSPRPVVEIDVEISDGAKEIQQLLGGLSQ